MKSVIIILLINILFFISANILAQEEKYLPNTSGEVIPVSDVEKYAKKNSYDMVLNSRILNSPAVLYSAKKHDITKEILGILNSQYKPGSN